MEETLTLTSQTGPGLLCSPVNGLKTQIGDGTNGDQNTNTAMTQQLRADIGSRAYESPRPTE